LAANALRNSKCPLGDYFRKVKSKEGYGRAVIATSHKLASIFYTLVTTKNEFNYDIYLKSNRINIERHLNRLNRKVFELKSQLLQLTEIQSIKTT